MLPNLLEVLDVLLPQMQILPAEFLLQLGHVLSELAFLFEHLPLDLLLFLVGLVELGLEDGVLVLQLDALVESDGELGHQVGDDEVVVSGGEAVRLALGPLEPGRVGGRLPQALVFVEIGQFGARRR